MVFFQQFPLVVTFVNNVCKLYENKSLARVLVSAFENPAKEQLINTFILLLSHKPLPKINEWSERDIIKLFYNDLSYLTFTALKLKW